MKLEMENENDKESREILAFNWSLDKNSITNMIALMFLRMSKFKHLKLVCLIQSSRNEGFTDIFDIRSTHNNLMVFYLNTMSSIAKQGEKHVENYANEERSWLSCSQ